MNNVLNTLSLARTALDDPCGLPHGWWALVHNDFPAGSSLKPRSEKLVLYAIAQIDRAMHALDVELYPVLALTTIRALIREIAEDVGGGEQGGQESDSAASDLYDALDLIASAIAQLGTDGEYGRGVSS